MNPSSSFLLFIINFVVIFTISLSSSSSSAVPINYDSDLAMYSLTFAKAAYCNATLLQNWSCLACPLNPRFQIYNVYTDANTSGQAFIGYDPTKNRIVVSWRGTWNTRGWEIDFASWLVPVPARYNCPGDCRIHMGYAIMYEGYRATLLADVQKLLQTYPGATIISTGHSMGGGISTLTTVDLTFTFPNVNITSYTFGTPRVGNGFFTQFVSSLVRPSNLVRITHKHDPVPRGPSRLNGYLHATQEIWYNNDFGGDQFTSLCINETSSLEDESCIDSVPLFEWDPLDHLLYLGRSTRCSLNEDFAVDNRVLTEELMNDPVYQFAVRSGKQLEKEAEVIKKLKTIF